MAARNDSQAAYDMLLALPDMNRSLSGGWLFDYKFEPTLRDDPIISRRWVFRSAHLIDGNNTRETKESRVKAMVWPFKKSKISFHAFFNDSDED